MYVTLPLTGVPGGLYNITVRNSDGVNTTALDVFYVTDKAWISSAPKTAFTPEFVQKPEIPCTGSLKTSLVSVSPSDREVIGVGIVETPGNGR